MSESAVGIVNETESLTEAQVAIEIKGLNCSYPDGTQALKEVDCTIYRGECVGIIGPNGAGKSTLLLHLNGVLQGNGEVKVFGIPVDRRSLPLIRQKVGLVFQDPDDQLFMPTVFDDVAFGPMSMGLTKDEVLERVAWALACVGMAGFEQRSGHHLSFGEKKRVSIATVLAMNPEVLVLDEPTSNLDPRARRRLISFLRSLSLTKVIATHDIGLVTELCQRCLILDGGRVVACGHTRDLFENKALLEAHGLEAS
ncbi:MAG: ABC transporter ATP-binding protein [Bacillota bacterium]